MKKYIGIREVEATPAWFINGVTYEKDGVVPRSMNRKDGYNVAYQGTSHKEWVPKEVFESTYQLYDTFYDRLSVEKSVLSERLEKLSNFITSDKFEDIVTDCEQRELLRNQKDVMEKYLQILERKVSPSFLYLP